MLAHVIGGDRDRVIPPQWASVTARRYGVAASFVGAAIKPSPHDGPGHLVPMFAMSYVDLTEGAVSTPAIGAARANTGFGIALCVVLAAAAGAISTTALSYGMTLGALTVALILGVAFGNALPQHADAWGNGISFSKKFLLRLGIVLYGFRLTLVDLQAGGIAMVLIDALVVVSTFFLAVQIGVRVFKLDLDTATLIGAGSSICGASAILATAGVIRATSSQTAVAISTVAVFGTAALLLYPFLSQLTLGLSWLPGGLHGYGVFIGSTVHEVGQVIAIASATGSAAADPAIVTKMGRVALLAPFLVALTFWRRPSGANEPLNTASETQLPSAHWFAALPWFPFLFAAAVLVNSIAPVQEARAAIAWVDALVLGAAMVALGASTRLAAIRQAGAKPLLLAGVLFVWLVIAGAFINVGVPALVRAL